MSCKKAKRRGEITLQVQPDPKSVAAAQRSLVIQFGPHHDQKGLFLREAIEINAQ